MHSLGVALSSPGKKKKERTREGEVFTLKQMKYLLNVFLVLQAARDCPAVRWKVWSLLGIVNADFNNGVKAKEVLLYFWLKMTAQGFKLHKAVWGIKLTKA